MSLNKLVITLTFGTLSTLLAGDCSITGCKDWGTQASQGFDEKMAQTQANTKAYQASIRPQVAIRQPDSAVIMKDGVVLKIHVFAYRGANKNQFYGGRDMWWKVTDSEFIAGVEMPTNSNTLATPDGKYPFTIRKGELDKTPEVADKTIVEYRNSLYESDKNPNREKQRSVEAANLFDEEIKNFIKDNNK